MTLSPHRRAQISTYRKDSDIVNELLTELERQEKQLMQIETACWQVLDTSTRHEQFSTMVLFVRFILGVIDNE